MPKATRGAVRQASERASCLKSLQIPSSKVARTHFPPHRWPPSAAAADPRVGRFRRPCYHTPFHDVTVPVRPPVCVWYVPRIPHARTNEDDAEIIARRNKRQRDRATERPRERERQTDTCRDWKGTKVSDDLSRLALPRRGSHHIGAICFVTSAGGGFTTTLSRKL